MATTLQFMQQSRAAGPDSKLGRVRAASADCVPHPRVLPLKDAKADWVYPRQEFVEREVEIDGQPVRVRTNVHLTEYQWRKRWQLPDPPMPLIELEGTGREPGNIDYSYITDELCRPLRANELAAVERFTLLDAQGGKWCEKPLRAMVPAGVAQDKKDHAVWVVGIGKPADLTVECLSTDRIPGCDGSGMKGPDGLYSWRIPVRHLYPCHTAAEGQEDPRDEILEIAERLRACRKKVEEGLRQVESMAIDMPVAIIDFESASRDANLVLARVVSADHYVVLCTAAQKMPAAEFANRVRRVKAPPGALPGLVHYEVHAMVLCGRSYVSAIQERSAPVAHDVALRTPAHPILDGYCKSLRSGDEPLRALLNELSGPDALPWKPIRLGVQDDKGIHAFVEAVGIADADRLELLCRRERPAPSLEKWRAQLPDRKDVQYRIPATEFFYPAIDKIGPEPARAVAHAVQRLLGRADEARAAFEAMREEEFSVPAAIVGADESESVRAGLEFFKVGSSKKLTLFCTAIKKLPKAVLPPGVVLRGMLEERFVYEVPAEVLRRREPQV